MPPPTLMGGAIFRHRRQQFAKRAKNGVAVFLASAPATKSRDTNYHYSPNRYLYYLSGCGEAHCALLMAIVNGKIVREIFLCRPHDKKREQWEGAMLNISQVRRQLAIEESGDLADFAKVLSTFSQKHNAVYYLPGADAELDKLLCQQVASRRLQRSGVRIGALCDASVILDEMRTRKDASELALLRRAGDISAQGMRAAMIAAKTAKNECEIEAAVMATFRRADAQHAFLPIVAAGKHACTLHYTQNNGRITARDMILADIGAEVNFYAGDISRTFPSSGKFSAAQSAVYDVVLRAQKRALQTVRAGARWQAVEDAATKEICKGLAALRLCRGDAQQIFKRKDYTRFYMHRVGHFVGLDVHDAGNMQDNDGKSCKLQTGMVVTIEPGLYIGNDKDIASSYRNIGVRIEDTVVVRRDGCEVLTAAAPKSRRDIESLMRT